MPTRWLPVLLRGLIARPSRRRWPDPPGPFGRRVPVGAGALIRDDTGRILLIQQTYRGSDIWLPPGGWVDRGERPVEAAAREVREELGVEVKVGRPLAIGGGGYGELTILFECRLLGPAAFRLSAEIERVAYFEPDMLPPMAEVTRRCVLEGLATQTTYR